MDILCLLGCGHAPCADGPHWLIGQHYPTPVLYMIWREERKEGRGERKGERGKEGEGREREREGKRGERGKEGEGREREREGRRGERGKEGEEREREGRSGEGGREGRRERGKEGEREGERRGRREEGKERGGEGERGMGWCAGDEGQEIVKYGGSKINEGRLQKNKGQTVHVYCVYSPAIGWSCAATMALVFPASLSSSCSPIQAITCSPLDSAKPTFSPTSCRRYSHCK